MNKISDTKGGDLSITNKIFRDGKVAVLISDGSGAGWYSWNTDFKDCLFCPEIVNYIINRQTGR